MVTSPAQIFLNVGQSSEAKVYKNKIWFQIPHIILWNKKKYSIQWQSQFLKRENFPSSSIFLLRHKKISSFFCNITKDSNAVSHVIQKYRRWIERLLCQQRNWDFTKQTSSFLFSRYFKHTFSSFAFIIIIST